MKSRIAIYATISLLLCTILTSCKDDHYEHIEVDYMSFKSKAIDIPIEDKLVQYIEIPILLDATGGSETGVFVVYVFAVNELTTAIEGAQYSLTEYQEDHFHPVLKQSDGGYCLKIPVIPSAITKPETLTLQTRSFEDLTNSQNRPIINTITINLHPAK